MRQSYQTLLIFFLFTNTAFGQILPEDITISLFPSDPKPGQKVTATAESFGIDLSKSQVSWYYNDKKISGGLGNDTATIVAPNATESATLLVVASSDTGNAEASITIRPASVDLVWEAVDAYTPPFYKGKALAPIGGKIRVTAIANTRASKNLSYSWKYNDVAVPRQSGANRNSLVIQTDVLGDRESFGVSVGGSNFEGSSSTALTLREPTVLLYQKNNGFIDYSKGSARDVYIKNPGVTLRAEPFNFSIKNNVPSSLAINFILDKQPFLGTPNIQELSITRPETLGESPLSISISSFSEKLQAITKSFILHF